jgi:hypothetical protein
MSPPRACFLHALLAATFTTQHRSIRMRFVASVSRPAPRRNVGGSAGQRSIRHAGRRTPSKLPNAMARKDGELHDSIISHSERTRDAYRACTAKACSHRSLNPPAFISHMFSMAGSNTGADREVSQDRILCAA